MIELLENSILYDDKDVIAVNKPEGLASISESDTSVETLHSILEKKLALKLFIVHRLDKEVSGVILFAKNAKTHKSLNQQFADRAVKKYYIALVHGTVNVDSGVINKPIREFGSGRMGIDEAKGKQSSTKFKVLKRYKKFTLLELNPSTGRRHQIRVHLYVIGHPVVGDIRYGDKKEQEAFPRLMLHAKEIGCKLSGEKLVSIQVDLPESFNQFLKSLE
jgi:RluA family pseudouridine synthase